MGKLLNIHAGMAHSPVVLAVYSGLQEAITCHGTFDARTREAIALARRCRRPLWLLPVGHTLGGKAAGWSDEELAEAFSHLVVNLFPTRHRRPGPDAGGAGAFDGQRRDNLHQAALVDNGQHADDDGGERAAVPAVRPPGNTTRAWYGQTTGPPPPACARRSRAGNRRAQPDSPTGNHPVRIRVPVP